MSTRRAYLEIRYNNANISEHIEPYVLGWTFTDNLSGQADDLQLTLHDRERLWINDWMPEKGSTIKCNIVRLNWLKQGQIERTVLGTFDIDEFEGSGLPATVVMKAISVPQDSSLNGERKNRAWEKTKLSVVLKDVANKNGLKLFYDTKENPEYDRIEQTEQTDLEFITKLCNDSGLSLKISNKSLVILDEKKYEEQEAFLMIKRITDRSISVINLKTNQQTSYAKDYSFRNTLTGTYKSCKVIYQDGANKKTISASYTPPKPPKTNRILVINERVSSVAEAQRLAKKRLREANKEAETMTFTLTGDLQLFAGKTILIRGFGKLDGKYLITQAVHSQQSGYETKISIRKCLEGY